MPAVCRSTRPPTEGKQLDELFGVQTLLWGAINPRACASVLAAMLGRGYPSRPPFSPLSDIRHSTMYCPVQPVGWT